MFKHKIVLANIVNKIAMRLYRVAGFFISFLIKYAISLDPNRRLFEQNLKKTSYQDSFLYIKKSFAYSSFRDHKESAFEYIKISKGKSVAFTMPIVQSGIKLSSKYECIAVLPDTYLAIVKNAQIFAKSDLIIVNNKVYYDEIDRNHIDLYAIKSPNISKITQDKVVVKIPISFTNIIETGIHLTKDHSKNYFHWLIEVLPRLSLISDVKKDIPILVSKDLPSQCHEALKVLNQDNRKIIKLNANKKYVVKNLYYPSRLSVINDNYKQPIYSNDAIYSPDSIKFVRDVVLKSLLCAGKKGKRKIFISRSCSDYRQILNSNEVEELLIKRGFEIIFPENLSFRSQVEIFSEAEIIIGQSGAGMANFIFAPMDCKIIIMMSDVKENNFQLFNALALASNIYMEFIIGKHIPSKSKYTIHVDFSIDTRVLSDCLDRLEHKK